MFAPKAASRTPFSAPSFEMRFSRPTQFTLATSALLCLSVASGCRNTTNVPISPLGQASPLTPVSPLQPQLSPIQPTSGISPFGASTRVPPPPTTLDSGSFNATVPFNSSYAPPATFGSSAVTSLGATPVGSGVQQAGWVGQSGRNGATTAGGVGFGAPANQAPPASARSGGLPVIDLTQAPNPPGYVPPATFGGNGFGNSGSTNGYPAGYVPPANRPGATNQTFGNNRNTVPLGQPVNSSFTPSVGGPGPLPSTEPVSSGRTASDQLNWQRPSPRF